MRLEALEVRGRRDGPLRRLDARWALIGTLAFVVAVVATPNGRWDLLAGEGIALAFVVGLAGVAPGELFRRWLGFLVLVGFLAAMVALNHPRGERLGVGLAIVAKNSLAFVAVLTLAGAATFPRLLGALGRLGAPAVLVATLHFMYRYLHVLGEELERMAQARRSRSFRRSGRLDWGLLTGLIGVLFVRALERGERVHAAMLARGWDGTVGDGG